MVWLQWDLTMAETDWPTAVLVAISGFGFVLLPPQSPPKLPSCRCFVALLYCTRYKHHTANNEALPLCDPVVMMMMMSLHNVSGCLYLKSKIKPSFFEEDLIADALVIF